MIPDHRSIFAFDSLCQARLLLYPHNHHHSSCCIHSTNLAMDQSSFEEGERAPQVYRGQSAGLEPLRRCIQSSSSSLSQVLQEERVTHDERLLSSAEGIAVTATWKIDDDDESSSAAEFSNGLVLVTSERILMVATEEEKHDVAIDAACIQLHAISNDDSVYLQIQDPESSESAPIEFTLKPTVADPSASCQQLFDALSQLVSMHPIPLDDDDDDDEYGDGVMFAPGPMDGSAPQFEREAMLERLDNILVVPPEYEVDEAEAQEEEDGQFDDADDDAML